MNKTSTQNRLVQVQAAGVTLDGIMAIPDQPKGLVIFVHGSGSSRNSPRNQYVASILNEGKLATLLFDLLTPQEEQVDMRTRHIRFDIPLLSERVEGASDWALQQPYLKGLPIGYFGASTGAAAALIAAADMPDSTQAVVSRGGRPDLADNALRQVQAPVLLIVGGLDTPVIDLNEHALAQMQQQPEKRLTIVPGATHLFEEPGTLEQASLLARDWFLRYFA